MKADDRFVVTDVRGDAIISRAVLDWPVPLPDLRRVVSMEPAFRLLPVYTEPFVWLVEATAGEVTIRTAFSGRTVEILLTDKMTRALLGALAATVPSREEPDEWDGVEIYRAALLLVETVGSPAPWSGVLGGAGDVRTLPVPVPDRDRAVPDREPQGPEDPPERDEHPGDACSDEGAEPDPGCFFADLLRDAGHPPPDRACLLLSRHRHVLYRTTGVAVGGAGSGRLSCSSECSASSCHDSCGPGHPSTSGSITSLPSPGRRGQGPEPGRTAISYPMLRSGS